MKKVKKILSIFLALAMISGSAVVCKAAETTPFKQHILPCEVRVVDFDNGERNVSYGTLAGKISSYVYRENCDLNIYNQNGEIFAGATDGTWFLHTVEVPRGGIYSVSAKGASTDDCTASITVDGEKEYKFEIPASGSYSVISAPKVLELELEEGIHKIKFTITGGGINIHSLVFDYEGKRNTTNIADKTGGYRNFYLPTIIEAEEFDYTGNYSKDNVNSLLKFREDAILDIGEISKDKYYLFCEKDEYATYTFYVEKSGAYAFDVMAYKDGQVTVLVDDVEIASKVDISSEGIKNLANVWLPKGRHKMKVLCENSSFSIDYFQIRNTDAEYIVLDGIEENEIVSEDTAPVFKDIYVSAVEGNDENTGEKDSPFKSIERAIEEVKKYNKSMTGDIVVHLAGGDYNIKEKLVINEDASGYNGFDVVYKGDSILNPPVINGGTEITNWKKQENSPIWVADASNVEETRTLYVNDIPAKLAKSKYEYNASSSYVVEGSNFANDGLVVSKTNFPKSFAHPEDLMLGWNILWLCQRTPVETVIDKGNELIFVMEQTAWNVMSYHGNVHTLVGADKPFFIENALELLDEPGEFYFDKYEKKMYYYPFSNEDMLTAKTYCGTTEQLLYLGGSEISQKLSNVELNNITFKYGALNSVNKIGTYYHQTDNQKVPNEKGDWYKDTVFPAQITVNHVDNISIKNCVFTCLGSNALNLDNGVTNTEVIGNKFLDLSGTGIVAGSPFNTKNLPAGQARCSNIEISNNVIRRPAQEYLGMTAIAIYYADYIKVSHNDIKDTPYSAIVNGWGWGNDFQETGGNNSIDHNRIENSNIYVYDGAPIYTLGKQPGSVISDNYIIHSADTPGGIYLDEGSEDYVLRNNVITRSMKCIYARAGVSIKNCYFENTYTDFGEVLNTAENVTVKNTVSVGNGEWPEEAVSIMNNAGVEPKYARLLDGAEFPEWRLKNVDYHPFTPFEAPGIMPNKWVLAREYTNFHEISGTKPDVYRNGEIGDTRPGEWVEFEIYIPTSCNYKFEIRGGDGWGEGAPECYAVVMVDGEVRYDHVTIPRNSWKLMDIPLGDIYLEEGVHTVRLCVEGNDWLVGGFKLDNGLVAPDSEGYDEGEIVSEAELMANAIGFMDVAGNWAEFEIRNLANNGIISGYDKYTFGPNDSLTLHQACILALRTIDNFDADWKNTAAETGLMTSADEPDSVITRERFCDVIMKAYKSVIGKYSITVTDSDYADLSDIDGAYLNSVYGARELELMIGTGDKFMPKRNLTRAEAAKVIYKLVNLLS